MSLKAIARDYKGDVYARGTRANIPAPGHSKHDRSVSLYLNDDNRVVVHSFNNLDFGVILDALRASNHIDANNRLTGSGSAPAGSNAPQSQPERIATALRIWNSGRALDRSLGEKHCRRRGILRDLPGPAALRFIPEAPVSVYQSASRTMPAVAAAIRNAAGDITAIEITYLDPNGAKAVGLTVPRKTVGVIERCSAVRLDPLVDELCVGEGIYTALSASERFGLPVWALLSTSNLRHWIPPPGVRRLLIAGDRGPDGEQSAQRLLRTALRAGVRASIAFPPFPHNDFNQARMAAKVTP